MFSSPEPSACSDAQRDIWKCLQPKVGPIAKRFFQRDLLFDFLSSGSPTTARSILECNCHKCAQQRRLTGTGNSIDQYLRLILGTTGRLPEYNSSAVTLFSLFVAIGYPILCRSLLDKGYDDKIFQLGPTTCFSKESLQKLWPMDDTEFELGFYSPLERHLVHFAVPHITPTKFTTYDLSTILPFINERPIGRVGEGGEIIDEGGFGKVSSFDIHDCYNQLGVHTPAFR